MPLLLLYFITKLYTRALVDMLYSVPLLPGADLGGSTLRKAIPDYSAKHVNTMLNRTIILLNEQHRSTDMQWTSELRSALCPARTTWQVKRSNRGARRSTLREVDVDKRDVL
jgi:hypothetical protein